MSSATWYWSAAASAGGCTLLALVVTIAGWRRRLAEVAVLGAALLVVSVLPLAHGLGGTGLFGGPPASGWAAAIALPGAAVASLPLFAPARLLRRWQIWVPATTGVATVSALLLVGGTTTPPPAAITTLLAIGAVGAAMLMRRQWTLYRIGGLRSSLVALVAIGFIAVAVIVSGSVGPGSAASWIVLTVENIGVLAASLAVLWGYRVQRTVAEVLAPIAAREPLMALEAGLSPEVHAFVAALERKDRITRDHVVRTSALALRVAVRAGLADATARDVAIGALLHDIGKLVVPSEILNKPGALTDEEFRTIKTHPEAGERLLEAAPGLVSAARFVRWHHERYDGRGYPDGLSGCEVGLDLGIVSAVDAWDAMTNTRQYRTGMPTEQAVQILRDGAGTQWHPDAVRLVLAEVRRDPRPELTPMSGIGARASGDVCDCLAEVLGRSNEHDDPAVTPTSAGADGSGGGGELVDART